MTEPPAKKCKMESELSDGSETERAPDKAPEKKSPTTPPSSVPVPVATRSSSPPIPARYTRGDLVTLLIGPEEQELVVCGTPLANASEFFKTALKKEWKEGQVRVIRLPEEDITLITRYLDFVFSQSLPSMAVQTVSQLQNSKSYYEIIELYTLGERMLNGPIRNAVVKEILRLVDLDADEDEAGCMPGPSCIKMIYRKTSDRSAARRLMVDLHLAYGLALTLENEKLHPEYTRDLAKAYSKMIEAGDILHHTFPRVNLKVENYFV